MITYNHEPYIAKAIDGVLQQVTDFPFELVIGEDCSSDGTRTIVEQYAKKHPSIIRLVTSSQNVGIKKNGLRNLQACRGRYVAFCEGDDHWHSREKLQKQVGYLEEHPDCGLVHSNYDMYYPASGITVPDVVAHRGWKMPEAMSIVDILEGKAGGTLGIATCTVVARKHLCDDIVEADPYLHQSDEFPMGDTPLWAEMATRARLHYMPESLATYTVAAGSAVRNRDVKKRLQFLAASARLHLYLCDKYGLPATLRAKHHEDLLTCQLYLALHTRNGDLAERVRRDIVRPFTAMEWWCYYGAKYAAIHRSYQVAASVRGLLRRKGRFAT